ncbi:hypothetical protein BD560DRAFT_423767 [Blakeslea trispora]|nr:hypothetical protein BD560DRAFT_423767 [Blakeslea trispora]
MVPLLQESDDYSKSKSKTERGETFDIYLYHEEISRKCIKQELFWKRFNRCVYHPLHYLQEQEKADITSICKSVTEKSKYNINSGIVAILKEQLKLEEEEKRDSSAYQTLQAMNFLLSGFEVWAKDSKIVRNQECESSHKNLG